jgi:hypothetical protein
MREELAAGTTGSGALAKFEISGERGDILAKYDQTILGKLKKEDGMNPKLFLTLETMDVANNVKAEDILNNLGEDGEDDIFDDGGDDEPEEGYKTKPKSKDHRNKDVYEDDDDINHNNNNININNNNHTIGEDLMNEIFFIMSVMVEMRLSTLSFAGYSQIYTRWD